jgi:hypothetical protein
MYSRDIKNINDIFDAFVHEYNMCTTIKKWYKTNIMEFRHTVYDEGNINIYCCDPNYINKVTFNGI